MQVLTRADVHMMFMALMVLTGGEEVAFVSQLRLSSAPAVRQAAALDLSQIESIIKSACISSRVEVVDLSHQSRGNSCCLALWLDRTCATWHENGQHVIVQAHASIP